ncbi:hypothetical protein H2198_001592 [Neophaeococcomyces mojaviensis]|uniref:Uncharacterized protein n=1 Tax=Neophaeococcomyces mojaviensis TaxID=3383035 RepID=A0ACC3AH36_9EURO|nr:hypothetical protein H2198_001592 [Knufia sp. JES_112]
MNDCSYTNGVSSTHDIHDVEHGPKYDEAIIKFLRKNIKTTWHPLETCKMVPLEEKGIMNEDFDVKVVKDLKCCVLSIVPKNIATDTMNTTLVNYERVLISS